MASTLVSDPLRFGGTPGVSQPSFLFQIEAARDRAQMARPFPPFLLFSSSSLLPPGKDKAVHDPRSNPSNSTPIFLSARATTPDGKLAYDPLYQVRNPSIVTLSPNECPKPRTRPALFSCQRQGAERMGTSSPWKPGGTEKIR